MSDQETPQPEAQAAPEAPRHIPSPPPQNGLLRNAIERPVTVIVGVILSVFFGAVAVFDIPIQLTPDVEVPTIAINTTWPGASPVEVESEILEEQEDVLKSVQGLVKMESQAQSNQGSITLEFEVGTNLDEALVRVSNALGQVPNYPESARQPVINTANSSGPPLAVIIISSKTGADVDAYRTWVEKRIVPQIERIKGVAGIRHRGGRDTEIHIDLDPHALAARGVSVADVVARVRAELKDVSGGDLVIGKRALLVRTRVAPERIAELERVVLGASDDRTPIVLGDVARVRRGLRKPTGLVFADDKPAMALILTREAGSNVLQVTEAIYATVERLQREEFDAEGLNIRIVSDQRGYITEALELVQQNLLIGAALAVLVLMIFLRSVGASIIISISIPVCVFGTALGMTLFGRTVNVVSLAGVTFAIGMVVDNSIVALENIDTWRGRVTSARDAAYRGVNEVWGALLASTLTTAAVFIPIIVWQGEVGELLRDIAYAVALAVIISLVVSVLVIPSLCARFLRPKVEAGEPGAIARFGARVRAAFEGAVRALCASWWRSAAFVLVTVAIASALGWQLLPKMEYLPTGNRNLIFGIIVPPPGYSPAEMERMGAEVQDQMTQHTGRDVGGVPAVSRSFFVGEPSQVFAGSVAEDPTRVKGLLAFVRGVHSKVPGAYAFAVQAGLFGRSIGGGRAVEVEITGADREATLKLAGAMFGKIRGVLPGAQVRPQPTLDPGAAEIHVRPRRDEAAALRMTGAQLGQVVDTYVDGAIIGEFGREGEPKVDVVLRASRPDGGEAIEAPEALMDTPVVTPSGDVVPLSSLARQEQRLGPTIIKRIERRRAIVLQVTPPESVALELAIERIRDQVLTPLQEAGQVPEGVDVKLSGTASKLTEARERFGLILLVAFLISYLLLAALFEDFLAPVAVLVTVPLAACGGIGALRLVDAYLGAQPLDLMTALGFLILIGVVVNNAILVVDGAIAGLAEGLSLEDAVPQAVGGRVRPIFMSTTTSLVGLLPMVISSGSGSELYRGVGAVVLGGLTLSTVLTLFVVPALFTLLWRLRR